MHFSRKKLKFHVNMIPLSDDEEDLWGDIDDISSTILSANLLEVTGKKVNFKQPHESTITWVPPMFAGLDNSSAVGSKGLWYNKEERTTTLELTESAEATSPGTVMMPRSARSISPQAASPPAPMSATFDKTGDAVVAFSFPRTLQGTIDWGAMGKHYHMDERIVSRLSSYSSDVKYPAK